ncbi:MAG TPA: hypothetical protein VLE93_00915 [Candidatus Saccharimonadales bacterium]|nr:hypothetical protein [Candidatus Saccharimonadales bacterium]
MLKKIWRGLSSNFVRMGALTGCLLCSILITVDRFNGNLNGALAGMIGLASILTGWGAGELHIYCNRNYYPDC